MPFDPENKIIRLCAQGMEKEGTGDNASAAAFYLQAWQEASDDFEKFTAAHYVARQQNSVGDKLKWDQLALDHALKSGEENIRGSLPSLYLNIAKCHEDLLDFPRAKQQYETALHYCTYLPDSPYGNLIRSGIENGLKRLEKTQ